MQETEFRKYLKACGKKEHVVEGLVQQVLKMEAHLHTTGSSLDKTGSAQIQAYADSLAARDRKIQMRGAALYYRSIGNNQLAELAGRLREKELVKTRKSIHLRDLRGVEPQAVTRLEELGIRTADHLLAAGKTRADRADLAARSAVSPETILELVKLADLSRMFSVKTVRTRLYYDAGVDTLDKLAAWEPEALRLMLVEFVQRTGFDGIAPLPKEMLCTVKTARELPRLIEY